MYTFYLGGHVDILAKIANIKFCNIFREKIKKAFLKKIISVYYGNCVLKTERIEKSTKRIVKYPND